MEASRAREVLRDAADSMDAETRAAVEALMADSQGTGLCHRGKTPEPLYLELSDEGLRYCCGHSARHCSVYLAASGS